MIPQAVRLPHSDRPRVLCALVVVFSDRSPREAPTRRGAGTARGRRAGPSQARITNRLSEAHQDRPTCQPSRASPAERWTAQATGAAASGGGDVRAEPPMTYINVTVAIRGGKQVLASTGSPTLPSPVPGSAATDAIMNSQGPGAQGRSKSP